ncbi:MAG: hypothetical protein LRY76_06720 [Alphaproteobacteria bacterium]|nr:hypothetical protein [Alphaproteobacteria bacterium]
MSEIKISTEAAWQELHDAFEREAARPANYAGTDWYQITPEEQKVFGIKMVSMPRVVTAYSYYEEILDLADSGLLPSSIIPVIRQDVSERFGMEPGMMDHTQFENFAKLFGISRRTAHAWFIKHEFWCVRRGIQTYDDDDNDEFLF